jgi:eukaryotic-like serine/threonine-protein kinase
MTLLGPDDTVSNTYRVERFLGEGAFAEVYRVRHRFLGRQAMKVLKTPGMGISEIEDLLQEAVILSQIGHPNIIRVFDANILEIASGTYGYFTMEYVAGGSLEQHWKSYGMRFMPVPSSVEIVVQACRGIATAHAADPPIVHRDIKPQNIMVGYEADGLRVRVSDFGLAKHANPLTLMVSARGTRCFKSPETFLDGQQDSRAGDTWALGCTLYLLLTDRLPFLQANDGEIFDSSLFGRPLVLPSQLNLDVDEQLEGMVLRSLALLPGDRYPTAQQMLEDLRTWMPTKRQTKRTSRGDAQGSSKLFGPAEVHPDRESASQIASEALELARQPGKLGEAADRMEEALNRWPEFREQYEYQIRLWRKGILS